METLKKSCSLVTGELISGKTWDREYDGERFSRIFNYKFAFCDKLRYFLSADIPDPWLPEFAERLNTCIIHYLAWLDLYARMLKCFPKYLLYTYDMFIE